MKTLQFFIFVVLGSLVSACSEPQKAEVDVRKIDFQVFITTTGGETIKLSNVPIYFTDENGFRGLVRAYNGWADNVRTTVYPGHKAGIEKNLRVRREVIAEHGSVAFSTPEFIKNRIDITELYLDYQKKRHTFLCDSIFRQDSTADIKGYTDADGVYNAGNLIRSPEKRYVFARGERLVGESKEVYTWIVPFLVDEDKRVVLSNINLFDADTVGEPLGFLPPPKLPSYPELHL